MRIFNVAASIGALLLTATLSGCDQGPELGPIRTVNRSVDAFDAIELHADGKVEISVGPAASLTIQAPEKMLERIDTRQRGSTLHIKMRRKDWFWSHGVPRVTYKITLPKLTALELQGGTAVRLAGFNGGASTLRIEGATQMTAEGRLEELTVSMAGAGQADLSELIANKATVTVDGVGTVYVHPTESLHATMNGVGAILYSGSPREVNSTINGLGRIGQRGPQRDSSQESDRPAIDPDDLQPEYEDPSSRAADSEVI